MKVEVHHDLQLPPELTELRKKTKIRDTVFAPSKVEVGNLPLMEKLAELHQIQSQREQYHQKLEFQDRSLMTVITIDI